MPELDIPEEENVGEGAQRTEEQAEEQVKGAAKGGARYGSGKARKAAMDRIKERMGRGAASKGAKKGAGKAAKEGGKALAKKGLQRAGQFIAQRLAQAGVTAAVAASGPIGWALLAILIVLIFIIIIIALIIFLYYYGGGAGKGGVLPFSPNDPSHQAIYQEYQQNLASGKLNIKNPRDREYIENSTKPEGDAKSQTRIDIRLLRALNYLAQRHELITVGAIISPYEDMPIDTIETNPSRNNQVVRNISAHKAGMAADIWEIDKVCVGCKDVCSDEEPCCCAKIPVQVRWQDDQPTASTAAQGSLRQSMISNIELSLGLPEGTLSDTDIKGNIRNSGAAQLESALGLPAGSIEGGDLNSVLKKEGQRELEEFFGLPPGSLEGATLSQQSTNIGAKDFERLLNLPYGSLGSGNIDQVAASIAKKRLEKELGLPAGTLDRRDWPTINQKLQAQGLTPQDITYLESTFGWPAGSIQNVLNDIQSGGDGTVWLNAIGKTQLSISLGIPQSYLNLFGPSLPTAQINAKETELGLPQNSLVALIDKLKSGQDISPALQDLGLNKLEQGFNLAPNSLKEFTEGKIPWQEVLARSEIDYSALTQDLGISLPFAQAIVEGTISGNYGNYGSLEGLAQNLGQQKIESYLKLPSGSISQILSGQATPESIANLAGVKFKDIENAWNLPQGTLTQLLSGDINGVIEDIGMNWLSKVTDIPIFDWGNVLNGDFTSMIQSEVFKNLSAAWGFDVNAIVGIFSGNINPSTLISIGLNYFFPGLGGLMGGILGGVLGGLFGGGCNTDCYRPTARANVHKVIEELLNMPAELNDRDMKVTQIITFSQDRDVTPFAAKLDEVYGKVRAENYGLFAMEEAWKNIHIGY